jgi:hypothetical protein
MRRIKEKRLSFVKVCAMQAMADFASQKFRMAIRQLLEPGESMMRLENQRYRNRG